MKMTNENGFYLGFQREIVSGCQFNGVMDSYHDDWFCGFMGIGDGDLGIFIGH